MTIADFKDKEVTIRSMDQKGKIEEVIHKRSGSVLGIRLMVRCDGKLYECRPDEIKISA